jgi:hypothetical protein
MSSEYRDGYMAGERYCIKERTVELIAVGALAFTMGGVFLAWVAQSVVLAV